MKRISISRVLGSTCALGLMVVPLVAVATPASAAGVVVALPNAIAETTGGGVGFAIRGTGLRPNVSYNVSSPGLDAACPGGVAFPPAFTATTDFAGQLVVGAVGLGCSPGLYNINVIANTIPRTQLQASVTIKPPYHPAVPKAKMSPASEKETVSSGSIATTVLVSGLDQNSKFTVSSPGLAAACATLFTIADINAFASTAGGFTTDFTGSDVLVFNGRGCTRGSYAVNVAEAPGGSNQNFDLYFTIL